MAILVSAAVRAMRSVALRAISLRSKHTAGGEIVDERRREIVQRSLVLRHVDILALAGTAFVIERSHQRARGEARSDEIRIRAVGRAQLRLGVTRDVVEARKRRHQVAEAGVIAMGPAL